MIWIWVLVIVAALLLLAGLIYWQFIIAEGTYMGAGVVALLYDWAASAYERIKDFDHHYEQQFLGLPLARALELIPSPLVLDVGTGTARLPRALFFQPRFQGQVIGLDLSRRMLKQAVRLTQPHADRLTFIWQDAQALPFMDDTFDAVTCLEMLEFTPDPEAVLRELVRVLRPGGVFLTSNRVGPDAPLLPRRALARPAFEELLRSLPLEQVHVRTWQVDYDLAWALKVGVPQGGGTQPLEHILRCPSCGHSPVLKQRKSYHCEGCGLTYPVAEDGVIEMAHKTRRWWLPF